MRQYDNDDFDDGRTGYDGPQFADPGGRSALRSGRRIHPCPTCGRKNRLTAEDRRLGYQCDACADALEGGYGF